jgi:soluble lytic murein transglycosylase-like protein
MMRLLGTIAFVLACHVGFDGAARADNFAFVDEQGGLHLSNVPDDQRYRRLDPQAAGSESGQANADRPSRHAYRDVIKNAGQQAGVEPALLHAVITVESGYNARAVSKRGASGLMQLMPETAKRYGVHDIFDPAANVRAGARYLADLLAMFDNDLKLALAAYNAGEAAVIRFGKRIPPYRETTEYVPKVFEAYRRFQRTLAEP